MKHCPYAPTSSKRRVSPCLHCTLYTTNISWLSWIQPAYIYSLGFLFPSSFMYHLTLTSNYPNTPGRMASEGSSTADSRFEALPQEMVVLVLERLASPEDLASIIRASPSALAALQCQRRSILTQVLRNSPLVLHELLGILNCPAFDPPLE